MVFARGDPVRSVLVLQAGEVKLSRHLKDGTELVLHRAVGPSILAEASVYSTTYHCDAICVSTSELRKVAKREFLSMLDADATLATLWSTHLSHSLQEARLSCEIMRMKRVSERVDAWLDWQGGDLPARGLWKGVAAQIGVSAEALYRELARRRSS